MHAPLTATAPRRTCELSGPMAGASLGRRPKAGYPRAHSSGRSSGWRDVQIVPACVVIALHRVCWLVSDRTSQVVL
jgi:hypothetical protein